ncbi:MAG: glycosyltransferase, partial [Candidatus Altiarchaeota archaeon]
RKLREDFGIGYVYFIDENFGVNDKCLEDVCAELKGSGIKWACETHFMVMTKDKLRRMAESGCVEVEYGLESGDSEVLKRLNKTIDLNRAEELTRYTIEVGLRPWLFLLVGSPGETKKSIQNTLNFVRKFPRKRISFSVDTPLPYPTTALWQEGVKTGKIKDNVWSELNDVSGTIGNDFTKDEVEKEKQRFIGELEKPLKVIALEPFGEGGIGQYAYGLFNAMSDYADVLLVTEKNYELETLPRKFYLFKLNLFPDKSVPFTTMLKLLRFIKNNKPDVFDIQWEIKSIFLKPMLRLLRMFRIKVVYTAHNVIPHEPSPADRKRLKGLYDLVDCILVHTEEMKRNLVGLFEVGESKVQVIPHGNCLAFLKESDAKEARKKLNLKDEKVILFLGFIREYKGLDDLIRAFGRVKENIGDVKLCIVGKPLIDFKPYEELIKDNNLTDIVITRLDYVPNSELGDYLSTADVVVLPYRRISQTGVVQPAYAFGKPVVVTNVGGLPEIVEDGKSGLIVKPNSPEELAEALIKILKEDKMREKMGEYARELAETKYSWGKIAGDVMQVYYKLK